MSNAQALRTRPDDAPPTVPVPADGPGVAGRWIRRLSVMLPAMVVTVAIAAVGIGDRSLWNDEYATWYASTLSLTDLFRLTNHIDAVISPYYLFMHAWIGLFGDSALSLRLPSLGAIALAAGLVALVGRRLYDAWVGLTAGLLFAVLPVVSRYGEEARPYAFAIAAATLATLLLLRALDHPSWLRWLAYGSCLTVVGLAHFVALTVALAHAVVVWRALRTRSDFRLLRWFLALFGTVTIVLPLAAKGAQESSAIDWIKADGKVVRQLPMAVFGSQTVATIILLAAVLSAVLLWFCADRSPLTVLGPWAVLPPLFCYLTFPLLHLFLHRYLLFTVPAWTILAAATIFNLVRLCRRRAPAWLTLATGLSAVAAVLYLGLPGQVAARQSPVSGEPDFHDAAIVVKSAMLPGDGIAYSGTFRNGRGAFGYELRKVHKPRDVFLAMSARELGSYGIAECKEPGVCAGDIRRIWLVTTSMSNDPFAGSSPPTAALLRWEFTKREVRHLSHVRVFLLTRKEYR